ncbi:MAG: hypothetical protein J6W33_01970 [Spirochaetia bacterium]|nr:hypothetical protein [Spirochaetia bacterium]
MMMNKIPEINRARGYFVYTADGKRYLDMALEGGRLIMGHRQKGYSLALKNVIDKGILSGYPSPYAYRLKQAVKALLGKECYVYLFKSEERAREVLGSDPINDPIILVLPVPADFAPGVIVSATELDLADEPVSPVILAGAVRAVYNLKAFLTERDYSEWEKAGIADACGDRWKVDLPYIYPMCEPDDYPAVWDAFFKEGIILSTDYDKPSLLPPSGELSEGMRKKILRLFS